MTGKYKAYPEYKDSGVEWIGKIPCDWDMWKITHACPYIASGTTPKSDGDNYYDGENLWVTTGELREGIIFDTQKKVTNKALIYMPTLRLHPEGSVAIAMYGATIGRLGIFGKEATTNQACCVMPPSTILHNKFLFYWLYATRQEIINLSSGGGQPNVNQEKIASLKVSAPNYKLQAKIANFLDYETTKIDNLIEKQQQFIQLLKEKRQVVISHAVTKGLNPNAKMRDSGVEWLGEIPDGWEISRLKYHTTLFEQGWSPQCDSRQAEGNEFGVLKVGCVNHGTFNSDENKALPKELTPQLQYLIQQGDLLISRANTKDLVGSAAVVDRIYDNIILCDKLYRLRFNELIEPQWVAYYLALPTVRQQIELGASGASHSMQNIGQSTIKELPIVIPSPEEVTIILSEIKNKIGIFELTLSHANEQIALLQERRTALISAAVTGKIDVRNWVAPKESKANKEVAA